MKKIITIGRQFGSGGRSIGKMLAKELDVPFYDKDLITRAAKESGFCEELIESHDERPTNSFLYNLVMDTYSFGYNATGLVDMPISQKVFLAQFNTIRKIAEEGPCVIVGRCADYALDQNPDHISVFISADMEFRKKRIMESRGLSEGKAQDLIVRKDKQRQSYYNYYSSKRWGMCDTYDIAVTSSVLGIEGTVQFLKHFVEACDQ
ncbi:MAG: cytidylate kinase-like family protein [Lachnospiraceae bacterium]|nr:cytidylate kinase-like family protein [Lachnospiraceae bacterium]